MTSSHQAQESATWNQQTRHSNIYEQVAMQPAGMSSRETDIEQKNSMESSQLNAAMYLKQQYKWN